VIDVPEVGSGSDAVDSASDDGVSGSAWAPSPLPSLGFTFFFEPGSASDSGSDLGSDSGTDEMSLCEQH